MPSPTPQTPVAPVQASDFLSLDLLQTLEKTMVKLGIATGEGGLENFGARLDSHLHALCAGVERLLQVSGDAGLPAGVETQAYRIGTGREALIVERVARRNGPELWAVRNLSGSVLAKDGEWEFEPHPSSRDEEFFARCRYETHTEALAAAFAAAAAAA